MRLFEIHDQKWFPAFLRDDVTEALQFIFRIGGIYRHSATRLRRAFEACKASRVLDLCSGGSGPWPWLHETLRDGQGQRAEVCLTDKYPNTSAFERIQQESHGAITYRPESVDATRVPANLPGFRTLFTSFHHFRKQEAVSILQDAVNQRQGIGVFEAPRCHPVTIVLSVLVLLAGFVTAPFIRPFRASRLFWTYLLPVIPLVLFYDGLVSCFRAYSLKQLLEMTASVHADGYVWEVGEETGGFATVTYLLGYPVK